jgi:hypothetical protein
MCLVNHSNSVIEVILFYYFVYFLFHGIALLYLGNVSIPELKHCFTLNLFFMFLFIL